MASFRESFSRSKTKKEKDLISLAGSIDKKTTSKKTTIDQNLKSIDKSAADELQRLSNLH